MAERTVEAGRRPLAAAARPRLPLGNEIKKRPEGKGMRKPMSWDYDEFWVLIPAKTLHPYRVPILEAFRTVDEPLSAIALVDLFDGDGITMWEAEHHLRALTKLGVLEPDPKSRHPRARGNMFDLPYRLTISAGGVQS